MTRIHPLFRFFIMIGMALVLSFSFPVSSSEERTSENETYQRTIAAEIHMVKPLLRQTAPVYSRLIIVAQWLPLLFMIYFLTILRIPLLWNSFKRCIPLLLRRLFLDPIKYTSIFVSRAKLPVL